ncbi:MAG: (Fe-S)-binding protein [Pseudomonadota bacterium]
MTEISAQAKRPCHVGLFVTCLVDLFRPSVGFASIKLLQDAGCTVSVPEMQTCCGQPAFNSGDKKNAQDIARKVIKNFIDFDYIVVPSGSCAGMLKCHYPELLAEDKVWSEKANTLSKKVFELTSFLVDILDVKDVQANCAQSVTYHDSCAGLRELKIKQQPRQLLNSVQDLSLREMPDSEVCCGFGGTFCVKYSDISNSIVQRKADRVLETGADIVLAGDMGCLMNIAGKLSKDKCLTKEGKPIAVRHVAEVLANMTDESFICEGGKP